LPDTTAESLLQALTHALQARSALIAQLHAEQTNAYRLFHGSVEGVAGLCVDRYGELLLVQSFHRPLPEALLDTLRAFYAQALPGLQLVYNDRSQAHSRIRNTLDAAEQIAAAQSHEISEGGVKYLIQARHGGQDPWLFLDLRAARRRVMQEAAGKRLLNLFAYTCGVGVAAACAGAAQVLNIDFAEASLAVGKQNAQLNHPPIGVRFLKSDAFAAMRQLSGIGQPQIVRGKRLPPFPKLDKQSFDLVFLDPPRYAKSPFGVVDLINDYPAVFKPALLCTAEGGSLICNNNVADVRRDAWLAQLERSALKAGRPIRDIEWIQPDSDFPCRDEHVPLKTVLLRV
jgi:23S rRNA (cytosine1962-C5)-methyltransferase